jgi:hypothetical protein
MQCLQKKIQDIRGMRGGLIGDWIGLGVRVGGDLGENGCSIPKGLKVNVSVVIVRDDAIGGRGWATLWKWNLELNLEVDGANC